VLSIVIPRLHAIETNIALFYSLHEKLPGSSDVAEIIANTGSDYLDIGLTSGTITMTINAPERVNKLHILDGKVLIAAPVISKSKIVSWHLAGELADRLRIDY
jgi:hypothetical protein